MKTKILGISGKKQSGKNTAANFLHGMQMVECGIIPDFRFTDRGELVVPTQKFDAEGIESVEYGVFSVDRKDWEFVDYMSSTVWPFIKLYSFADILKSNICMSAFGLTYEQCYGSDSNKNEKTHLRWEDVPTGSTKKGQMTAREVMQYIGTEVFRRFDTDIWAKATIRQVKTEASALAVICDCRFPNEVKAIHEAGGKVIRMNRNNHGDDDHDSECALDENNFDWSGFDAIVDNQNMTVQAANESVYKLMLDWNMVQMEYTKT